MPNIVSARTRAMANLIVVFKGSRRLYLKSDDRALKNYRFDLGWAPVGHKQFEGDGRTPEGTYIIDRRNPNSNFHLSLGISYPNVNDVANAQAMGRLPGGDIFIHGWRNYGPNRGRRDWTAGCIAVTNRHVEDIWERVADNTLVVIQP
ncbi:MAG: L,D-transpeptidase family protein [Paracoccaceae bacterium]